MADDDIIPLNQLKSQNDDVVPIGMLKRGGAENFLKNAIKAFTPQSSQEWRDVPNIAANATGVPGIYNILNKNPIAGFTEMGGKMNGIQPQEPQLPNFPASSTPWGGEMDKFIGNAQLATGGALGLKRLGEAGLGAMDVGKARRALSDIVQSSASKVEGRISEASQAANTKMGKGLSQIGDTGITQQHFNDALRKTAYAIDPSGSTHSMPGSLANQVLKNIEPIEETAAEVDPASGISLKAPSMSGPQVQAKMAQVTGNLDHPVAKSEFWKQFSSMLPDSLKNIKSARGDVYNAVENVNPLTKIGTLNKIGKNTMGPQQLRSLQQAEKGIGNLNVIQDLIKGGKAIRNAQTAKNIGQWGVGLGTSALGLEWLKKLFSSGQRNDAV